MVTEKKAIVLAANYAYEDQVLTTMKSLLFHNESLKFYIINSDFPGEWFHNLNARLAPINSEVVNCRVSSDRVSQYKTGINYTVFLRYFIPDFVEEDRVLYVDSDMVITGDIRSLYDMDMQGLSIAAVQDHGGRVFYAEDIFNAGFLLIDNAVWKRDNITQTLIDLTNELHDQVSDGDQSILNILFKDKWLRLSTDFNYIVTHSHFLDFSLAQGREYPTVIHYLTHRKPWKFTESQLFRELWWFYNSLIWEEIYHSRHRPLREKDIYPNGKPLTCLVFTYAAEMEHIDELIQAMPDVHFNITCRTLVGEGIYRLLKYPNVTVYPAIGGLAGVEEWLIKSGTVLLDINYGPKVDEALNYFADQGKPIFSFESTKQTEHGQIIFPTSAVEEMVAKIRSFKR